MFIVCYFSAYPHIIHLLGPFQYFSIVQPIYFLWFALEAATLFGDTGTYIETSEWPNHTHTLTHTRAAQKKNYTVSYTKNKQKQLKKRDNGSTSFMPRISTLYRKMFLCFALKSLVHFLQFLRFRHRKVGKLFFVTFRPYKIACFCRPTAKCLTFVYVLGSFGGGALSLSHRHTHTQRLSLRLYYTRTRCTNAACKWRSRLKYFCNNFGTPIFTSVALGILADWGSWQLGGFWGIGTARFYL